jgi:hypothetical protein
VGVVVKHRQLARPVGAFIEHPPENWMASFNFTSTVLDEGTTFIFSSWICDTNSLGGFNNHLAHSSELEASSLTRSGDLDELVEDTHWTLECSTTEVSVSLEYSYTSSAPK